VLVSLAGPPGAAEAAGDPDAPHLVYSVTKSFIAAAYLRLADAGRLGLDDPLRRWIDDARLPEATLRQLLDHTSGIPDYGRLPEYHAAVRARPGEPWSDEELLDRALALGLDFAPGGGWAYSNTGYLLLRRILDGLGGLEPLLAELELRQTCVAREPDDLRTLAPGVSETLAGDVRGRYHPGWVGHRTLVSTCRELHRFWTWAATTVLAEPATFVPIGFDAPGFVRPAYGLGVMADPGASPGPVIGHGGGGPGYAAAAFAAAGRDGETVAAVVLSGREPTPGIERTALRLLAGAAQGRGSGGG
jgi:D-alanyl-D-alanine carboxypeptidase